MLNRITLVLSLGAVCLAQDAARMDLTVQPYVDQKQFMGSVLVARGDQVLFSKSYGSANLEWNIPNTPSTKFRLGSITKQFTSMAIMQLEDRGKLKVEDPIAKHLTDYPAEVGNKVTIHHLLTHTSGIPSYTDDPTFLAKRSILPLTIKEMIESFKDKPLEFEPGSKWKYDNSGYFLLGAIIEKASGMPYEKYLQESIFGPLGMKDSGYDRPGPILKNRASGYQPGPNGMTNAPYLDMGLPYAAGSLYSTVEDLFAWDQSLYTEKLVKKASLDRMMKAQMTVDQNGSYGYGWMIATTKGHKQVAHGGGINGFATFIARFPEERAAFIYLRNVTSPLPQATNNDLTGTLFGESIEPPKEKVAVPVDPKSIDALPGKYELRPGVVMEVTREGNRVFAQLTGQGRNEIFPASETRYFLRVVEAELEFLKNDQGVVDRLVLHQGGRDLPARKVN